MSSCSAPSEQKAFGSYNDKHLKSHLQYQRGLGCKALLQSSLLPHSYQKPGKKRSTFQMISDDSKHHLLTLPDHLSQSQLDVITEAIRLSMLVRAWFSLKEGCKGCFHEVSTAKYTMDITAPVPAWSCKEVSHTATEMSAFMLALTQVLTKTHDELQPCLSLWGHSSQDLSPVKFIFLNT